MGELQEKKPANIGVYLDLNASGVAVTSFIKQNMKLLQNISGRIKSKPGVGEKPDTKRHICNYCHTVFVKPCSLGGHKTKCKKLHLSKREEIQADLSTRMANDIKGGIQDPIAKSEGYS